MRRGRGFWLGEAGASAVEFALTIPALLALVIGLINVCVMLYANAALHYSVENTARCMSVSIKCDSTSPFTKTIAYAKTLYTGPSIGFAVTPTAYDATTNPCGNKISGAGSFTLVGVLVKITVPLAAKACYPINA